MSPLLAHFNAFHDAFLKEFIDRLSKLDIQIPDNVKDGIETVLNDMKVSPKNLKLNPKSKKKMSGYQLFLKESKHIVTSSGKDKLMSQAKLWREKTEPEREEYRSRAREMLDDLRLRETSSEEADTGHSGGKATSSSSIATKPTKSTKNKSVVKEEDTALEEGSSAAGKEGSTAAGKEGSTAAGKEGSTAAGKEGSSETSLPKEPASRRVIRRPTPPSSDEEDNGNMGSSATGRKSSTTAGRKSSSAAGRKSSSAAGRKSSSATGRKSSSAAGKEGSSAAGKEGSSAAGKEGSSAAGKEGSSAAGKEGSSAAGKEGSSAAGKEGSSAAGKEGSSEVSSPKKSTKRVIRRPTPPSTDEEDNGCNEHYSSQDEEESFSDYDF
jgi:hypothetical protein